MELIYLLIVFAVLITLIVLKRPLWQAALGASVVLILLYRVPLLDAGGEFLHVVTKWSNFQTLLALFFLFMFQLMLTKRDQIRLAEKDLDGIFHNNRIGLIFSSIFIGLLPSVASMNLAAELIDETAGDKLENSEKASMASWYRHIPESSLPTYASVMLMTSLAGISNGSFMLGMIVPVITLCLLGMLYLRKVPRDPGTPKSENRWKDVLHLIQHLWAFIALLFLIFTFNMDVVFAAIIVIFLCFFVYRYKFSDLPALAKEAFQFKTIFNSAMILALKNLISYTGVLGTLPDYFKKLPVPTWLVFAALFFFGSLISGTQGIVAMAVPLAVATIPDGGTPLMILAMCMCHAAAQISPVHVCIAVATEYFHTNYPTMVKKTMPMVAAFVVLMIAYYLILSAIF